MRRSPLVVSSLIGLGFLAGLGVHSALPRLLGESSEAGVEAELEKVRLVHDLIEQAYVEPKTTSEIFDGALKGMLGRLDPFSEYLTPAEFAEMQIDTMGEFGGLGMEVSVEDDVLTVVTPLEDTPAFRAGVLPGDKIIEVDGASTEGMSATDAVKLLRGKPGTSVELSIFHRGALAPAKIPLVREEIQVKSVKGARLIDPAGKVAYLRVTSFQEHTVEEFDSAIKDLRAKGMKALVLDLRFNGGGLLDTAVELADRFIAEGVIVSTRGRMRTEAHSYRARKDNTLPPMPLAILVNGSSASASELVTGAFQDYRRGIVIGSRTYGKGSVQSILPMENGGGAVKLTTAKYYTPSGRCIHREKGAKTWGIDPDIDIEFTPEEELALWESRRQADIVIPAGAEGPMPPAPTPVQAGTPPFVDTQLQRAVDVLKGLTILGK